MPGSPLLHGVSSFSDWPQPPSQFANAGGGGAAAMGTSTRTSTGFIVWLVILGIVIPGLMVGALRFGGFQFVFRRG